MSAIQLFDKYGKFVMPSAETIATLDAETQERFRTVQEAATNLENYREQTQKPAEQAVKDLEAERESLDARLKVKRARITLTQNAKDHIASERAQW
jgi:hypothetical protein